MDRYKFLILGVLAVSITGCSTVKYLPENFDSTSGISEPTEGRAGVYVYQAKTGVIGSFLDVDFEIKGYPTVPINTGEYAYFEVLPGKSEYKLAGGILPKFEPVEFEAGHNYFFRAYLVGFHDASYLVGNQPEIDAVKQSIVSGRYELNTVD
ncbi:hypothetical protein DN730_03945 [Marinomonas piezotolerans]|uniref:DUF2846 domain-containing protein n=1 Tax=Marinomonas piezotolerans TaxID=2213058 RepID=A0A370UEJ0_9GAMM|nr:DUF2846 domain-containing protein [Marinomonas piezotolerans]RDL46198.1 hypothetical protein DN730_03945 [Marinomonas piezotolerans]